MNIIFLMIVSHLYRTKYFIHHSFLYDIITILSEKDLYQNDLHHFSNKIK